MQQQSVFCWYKIGIEWEKYQIVFIAAALKTEQEVESIVSTLSLTIYLPWVTKTGFFLTISIQYQPDNWWEKRKY